MKENAKRVEQLTKLYKDQKFMVLNDLHGQKLETVALPIGAIGEFELQENITGIVRSGTRKVAAGTAIGTGRWWINGREYAFNDKMTVTLDIYPYDVLQGVYPHFRQVTHATSIGTIATSKVTGEVVNQDESPSIWKVPGFESGAPFQIPQGTKFKFVLKNPIPVGVE